MRRTPGRQLGQTQDLCRLDEQLRVFPRDPVVKAGHSQGGALCNFRAGWGQLRPQADGCQHINCCLYVMSGSDFRVLVFRLLVCVSIYLGKYRVAGCSACRTEMRVGGE